MELRREFLAPECRLVERIQPGRLVIYISLHFVGFLENAGGKYLLPEVPVVNLYSEDSLEKILQLPDGKLLRKHLEGNG